MTRSVYLDNNATTPLDPGVYDSMLPYLREDFGNPSSSYSLGFRAKKAIQHARTQVATLIGAQSREILFTSGGSEANSTILMGVPLQRRTSGGHIITTLIEHPAILNACEFLQERFGYTITYLAPDAHGVVDPEDVRRALRPETVLVTVMMINNEVGSIQPIREIGEICREQGIHFHCDAVQAIGKIEVDVNELLVDSLSASAHKLGGPKGVGALYVKTGVDYLPLIHGGGQETGMRSGTENVAGIVGFGMAAELAGERLPDVQARMEVLRDLFLRELAARLDQWTWNGSAQACYPSTLNLSFEGIRGEALQAMLNQMQVYVSIGSACSSTSTKLSHVLQAMGKSVEEIRSAIRFSIGFQTTEEDILHALDVLTGLVERLRSMSTKLVKG